MIKKEEISEKFEIYKRGIARLKELEKQLNSLNTKGFKKEEEAIRKKLKYVSLIPEIEKGLIDLKLKIAGVHIGERSGVDKEQDKRLSALTRQDIRLGGEMNPLKRKLSELSSEIEKVSKLAGHKQLNNNEVREIREIPEIKGKLKLLDKAFEMIDELNKKRSIDESQSRRLRDLKKEFAELKEILPAIEQRINLAEKKAGLAVGLSRKEHGAIAKEARNVDEIARRILFLEETFENKAGELRDEIEDVRWEARKKQLSGSELEEIKRIPSIEAKIRSLRTLFESEAKDLEREAAQMPALSRRITILRNIFTNTSEHLQKEIMDLLKVERVLTSEIKEDEERLPKIQNKTNYLSRIFRKEKKEVEDLGKQVDKYRVETYERLSGELAESKRMIEEEKFALREQLLNLMAESLREVNKNREEADKKIMKEIEALSNKIEESKKDIDKEVISKIVQIKGRVDYSKEEMKKELDKRLQELKNKLEMKLLDDERKDRDIIEREVEQKIEQDNKDKSNLLAEKKPRFPKQEDNLGEDTFIPEISNGLPELPELGLFNPLKQEKIMARYDPAMRLLTEKRNIPIQVHSLISSKVNESLEPITSEDVVREIKGKKPAKMQEIKVRAGRISKTAFIRQEEFDEIVKNINQINEFARKGEEIMIKEINLEKKEHEADVKNIQEIVASLRTNASKFASTFPVKL